MICSICMETIGDEFGRLCPCNHTFCFECITKWTTDRDTCPLCRTVSYSIEHVFVSKIEPKVDLEKDDDLAWCLVCRSSEREEVMLLCDRCDASIHTYCLRPPLEHVPEGDWFCPQCATREEEEEEEEEDIRLGNRLIHRRIVYDSD